MSCISSDGTVNHLEPSGHTLLRIVTDSGQSCGSSHRALRMSAALVPFLVPCTMRWGGSWREVLSLLE